MDFEVDRRYGVFGIHLSVSWALAAPDNSTTAIPVPSPKARPHGSGVAEVAFLLTPGTEHETIFDYVN